MPVHVTLRIVAGLQSLRGETVHRAILGALADGTERLGMRVVHYGAMSTHIHLLCEADSAAALSKGMQGISVRIARSLNRTWRRRGVVFEDRFHSRALRTPKEVHHAIGYVLRNAHHHGAIVGNLFDPCSSATWFDGWKEAAQPHGAKRVLTPLSDADSWLLAEGWRQHGLLERQPPEKSKSMSKPSDAACSRSKRVSRIAVARTGES